MVIKFFLNDDHLRIKAALAHQGEHLPSERVYGADERLLKYGLIDAPVARSYLHSTRTAFW